MAIAAGDRILAFEVATGRRWLLHADGQGPRKQRGLGVLDTDRLVGQEWGAKADLNGKQVRLLRPALDDMVATLRRKAQVILAKDASRILFELGLAPGDRVLESGIGSGAMTMGLCHSVGADGKVVVQELREDFAEWALENLARAGYADRVEVAVGDLTEGLAEGVAGPFQGVVLDQPEPWRALPHLLPHLDAGARLAVYCPQVSQMEATFHTLQAQDWIGVRALELIERGWEVKERGSRPSFGGLGHTGFLVFARWPGPP